MFETGAYGTRMARYLRLPEPPLCTKLGSGQCELAVTHLHAAIGYSEPASSIPAEKAFSIHLHLQPTSEGRLWLGGRLLPTINRLAGGVTILDLEQDPVCFFPNPSEVLQFYVPRLSLEEFSYQNRLPVVERLACPHGGADAVLHHLGSTVLSMMRRSETASKLFLDNLGPGSADACGACLWRKPALDFLRQGEARSMAGSPSERYSYGKHRR